MSTIFTYPNGPLDWAAQPKDFTSDDLLRLYTTETTQRYVLGTRQIEWDGRIRKYSLSNGACRTAWGAMCNTGPFIADDGTVHPANTTAVGDTSFTIAGRTVAKDALAGGYVILYTSADESTTQFRGIVGNTAGAATTITVYLDAPLTAIATADSTDMAAYYSPYYGLSGNANISRASVVCVPTTYVSASGKFFWGQTWGPIRVSPGMAGFGDAAGERHLVFGENGCLFPHDANRSTTLQYQHAGFIIPLTASADDAPLLMLQLSI